MFIGNQTYHCLESPSNPVQPGLINLTITPTMVWFGWGVVSYKVLQGHLLEVKTRVQYLKNTGLAKKGTMFPKTVPGGVFFLTHFKRSLAMLPAQSSLVLLKIPKSGSWSKSDLVHVDCCSHC